MGNDVMQDYKGNASFSRWLALACFVAAVAASFAIVHWPQVQQSLLHAMDKLLETGVWVFLGGKSPEMLDALRAKIQGMETKP